MAIPSIIVSSCLISQYLSTHGSTSSLVCGHPLIMYWLNICSFMSPFIAVLMSSTDMHNWMSSVLVLYMYIFISVIFLSLWSAWIWWDSHPTIYNSGPGWYKTCMLYWCMHSMMHCNCWDNVLHFYWTSSPKVYSLLLYIPPWQSSSDEIVLAPTICLVHPIQCCCTTVPCWIGSYLKMHSAGGFALSGTLSCPQVIPFLTCNKPAPRSMPDASISRYRGFNVS